MSSGTFDAAGLTYLFEAPEGVDPESYVVVTYLIGSSRSGEESALAMAMEQSVAITFVPDDTLSRNIRKLTAKVISVEALEETPQGGVSAYDLDTEVYQVGGAIKNRLYRLRLAFPRLLLMNSPTQWLNVLVGEIPRLGFVTSLLIEDIELTVSDADGPGLGVAGLRRLLRVERSPLLCRAMRPPVGLDLETMRRINIDVLTAGFHVVKDDELQAWDNIESYRTHIEAMVSARKSAEDASGEKKLYIANLLCDGWDLERRLEIACRSGVDAFLVAPAIQGLSAIRWVKEQSQLPILSHNSFSDLLSRHRSWGLAPAFLAKLQRYFGADWLITPGDFSHPSANATEAAMIAKAAQEPMDGVEPSMLIMQGGKNPAGLGDYVRAANGTDFMLTVASWIDRHPEGMPAAARIFRESVDALSGGR